MEIFEVNVKDINFIPSFKPNLISFLFDYRKKEASEFSIFCCICAKQILNGEKILKIVRRYLGWVYYFPIETLRNIMKYGKTTKYTLGRTIRGQIYDMFRLANRTGIEPEEYYCLGIGRFHGGPETQHYISAQMLSLILNPFDPLQQKERSHFVDFNNKRKFELHCIAHQFPCAQTVVVIHPEMATDIFGRPFVDALPQVDLFVKPDYGKRGREVKVFRHAGSGRWAAEDGDLVSGTELLENVTALSRSKGGPMLVQKVLKNRKELACLAGKAFATTRIITLLNENGSPEIVYSCLRTSGRPNGIVDNYHAGGVAFPINIQTGEIAAGRTLNFAEDPKFYSKHPVTHAQMKGVRLPCWKQAAALAVELHRSLPEILVAGWDIGFTSSGPRVVEVNIPPGLPVVQMTHGFLGTRYSQLLAFHARSFLEKSEHKDSRWLIAADLRAECLT